MTQLVCSYCLGPWDYNHEIHGQALSVRKAAVELVHDHRGEQETKVAEGKYPYSLASPDTPMGYKLAVLDEERGEVGRACVELERDDLLKELVHEAACCIAWIECLLATPPGRPWTRYDAEDTHT